MSKSRKVKQHRNRAVGAVAWHGGRLYVKRRIGKPSRAPRVAAAMVVAAVVVAAVARQRSGGEPANAPVA